MILLSTKLCLKACNYLVEGYSEKRLISAKEIAERYNINQRAILPSLNKLVKAKILHSQVGGRNSGFILIRDPKDVSILEILTVLQGRFEFDCCANIMCGMECEMGTPTKCPISKIINTNMGRAAKQFDALSLWELSRMFNKKIS